MLQSEHKKINQLPRLGGRWVPGKPKGVHCGQPCQPLDRILPHGWQIPTIQPWAPIPGIRHTAETVEGRKIRDGRGEDTKWTAPHTAAQMVELTDPSSVCRKLPCTMWACTYGIDCWMLTKLVDCLTAKLVDCLTTKFVNCYRLLSLWNAWLLSSWTTWAKLVVVNFS